MKKVLFLVLTVGLNFCAHKEGVCQPLAFQDASGQKVLRYRQKDKDVSMNSKKVLKQQMDESQYPITERVYVFISDGTLQCEKLPPKLSIDEARARLEAAQIPVFEASPADSGMMMIQVCGAPTGRGYRFQIPKSYLKKAISLGFELWAGQPSLD